MSRIFLSLFVLFTSFTACHRRPEPENSPTRGRVTAIVAESHAALMQKEVEEFQREYPAAKVTLLAATTREAIVHLLNDSVRIVIIDRPLNAEEQAVVKREKIHLTENKVAEDALVVVVHEKNPLEQMTLATLADIVRGKITDWNRVPESSWSGPIEFAFTGRNSGAYELLVQQFLKLQEDAVPTFIAPTQNEVLDYVMSHPRALGIVSAASYYCMTRPQGVHQDTTSVLRALALERQDSTATSKFVKLHQANIYRGFYPLHYGVYIYTTSSPNRDAGPEVGFGTFVASNPGQKIIMDVGLVPAKVPIRLVQTNED